MLILHSVLPQLLFKHPWFSSYYVTNQFTRTESTREHWIQRITFTVETNVALRRAVAAGQTDTHTDTEMQTTTIPSPLATVKVTREHWIQRITFAIESNAAETHRHNVTDGRQATQYLHSLSNITQKYLKSFSSGITGDESETSEALVFCSGYSNSATTNCCMR